VIFPKVVFYVIIACLVFALKGQYILSQGETLGPVALCWVAPWKGSISHFILYLYHK